MSKRVFSIVSILLALVFVVSIAQPAYSSNDGKVRVWVEFSPGNGARVEKALQGFGAEFHYRFEDLNSFVVTVPEQALEGLSRNPNVESIEEDPVRYPMSEAIPEAPYGVEMVQALEVWDGDHDGEIDTGAPTGEGITVCIIDSGFYAAHEDLSSVHFVGGYTDIPGTSFTIDGFGHGTHVAGTIAAAFNDKGVVGVSPGKVSLFIVKVFGDDGAWAYSSTLANAANRCGEAGANIISMSLGGTQKNKQEERAFNTLYNQGVLSIAAAGNDGNTAISYPGGYSSVMAVAAIDENMQVAEFSQQNSTVEIAAPGVSVLSTVPYISENYVTVSGVQYSANHVEYSAEGTTTAVLENGGLCTSVDSSLNGKIALCERGEIDFFVKVKNAADSGAVGVIIYNNNPAAELFTLGEGNTSGLIAISISQVDGQYLVNEKTGSEATIFSKTTSPASGYEAWDGTSMATPHVSGVAALIWSADPTKTNVEVRDALTSTAMDLGDPGRDVYYGYGLVQAKAALDKLNEGNQTPGDQINVSISGVNSTYSTGDTVTFTVEAKTDGTTSLVGGTVKVLVTNNKGKTVANLSETTSPQGTADFDLTLTRKMGTGTFTITATVSKESYIEGTATKQFIVK